MEDINTDNYSLPGVLKFVADKFNEFDMERVRWTQEREDLLRQIADLKTEKELLEQQLADTAESSVHFDDSTMGSHHSHDSHLDNSLRRNRSTSRLSATRKVLQRYLNRYESEAYSGSFDFTNSLNRNQYFTDPAPSNSALARSDTESAKLVSRQSSGSVPEGDLPNPKPSPLLSATAREEESGFDDMEDIDVRSICELQRKKRCDVPTLVPDRGPKPASQSVVSGATGVEGHACADPKAPKSFSRRRGRVHAPAIARLDSISSPPTIPPPPPPVTIQSAQPAQTVTLATLVKPSGDEKPSTDAIQVPMDDKPSTEPRLPLGSAGKPSTQRAFPLDAELTEPPKLPQYSTGRRSAFHLSPLCALRFSEAEGNALLSVDRNHVICVWETPRDMLYINDQPSQVIYGSQTRYPVLTGIWLPAVQGVATAGSDGTITVYRVNKSSPSSRYVDGNVTDVERATDGVPANGLFDPIPSTPLSEFTEHSDAVWTLFNNEKAQDRSRFLLFSASASGSLLSHDLERDCVNRYPSHETEEGQDIILSLVSNEKHSDHLFCGHHSGCSTMMDVETRQIVRTFTPHDDEWSGDSVYSLTMHESLPLLAAGTKYGKIHLFDVRDPTPCASFCAHSDSVSQVCFHPWCNILVSTGYDGVLRLWNPRERTLIHQYKNICPSLCDETGLLFSISMSTGCVAVGGATGSIHCLVCSLCRNKQSITQYEYE